MAQAVIATARAAQSRDLHAAEAPLSDIISVRHITQLGLVYRESRRVAPVADTKHDIVQGHCCDYVEN